MKHLRMNTLAVVAIWVGTVSVSAQSNASNRSVTSIGSYMGLALTRPSELGSGLELNGTVSRRLASRVAVEGDVGVGTFGITSPGTIHDIRRLSVGANVRYNWEQGRWQPFLVGGIGYYHFTENSGPVSHRPNDGDANTFGTRFGGGLEYTMSRRASLHIAARYHAVPNVVTLRSFRGSFSTVTVGFTRHF